MKNAVLNILSCYENHNVDNFTEDSGREHEEANDQRRRSDWEVSQMVVVISHHLQRFLHSNTEFHVQKQVSHEVSSVNPNSWNTKCVMV